MGAKALYYIGWAHIICMNNYCVYIMENFSHIIVKHLDKRVAFPKLCNASFGYIGSIFSLDFESFRGSISLA